VTRLKLGAQLNISFALVLVVPMVIATVFSLVFYSRKIQEQAVNTITSDMRIASLIYRNAESEMTQLATGYAQRNILRFLESAEGMGERIGEGWAEPAAQDRLDMITVVNRENEVLVRSHAPRRLNDIIPQKPYLDAALAGETVGGTEILSLTELETEGLSADRRLLAEGTRVLSLTGAAPIYGPNREDVVAALVVRRLVNARPEILTDPLSRRLDVRSALFVGGQPVAAASPAGAQTADLVLPGAGLLESVLERNAPFHIAEIRQGGGISKFMPVADFTGEPVAVLMVQAGVAQYLRTRNIAVATLLGILAVGLLLAFLVKTIVERRIVTPVKRLKSGVEKIGGGEYAHRLEVASADEIGELTTAFNRMAEDLQEYDRRVQAHSHELEQRVAERTEELQVANRQLLTANQVMEETLERLNPGVSRLIGDNKQQLGLVWATELVADICNYTKLNMILGDNLMGEFMKKFFREGHKLLAQYRGMFDKTVGDQIVAIFGTPKDQSPASPAHPADAVACALQLVAAAERINRRLQEAIQDNYGAIAARLRGLSREDREGVRIEDLRFQCRVGINTSDPKSDREIDRMRMVMMGAETCVDYTAQGGAIIYAFRLESSGVPGEIHIGENTRRLVEHVFMLEEMPAITLKGLGSQTRYRVLGYQSPFDTVYPRTRFYQTYGGRPPERMIRLIDTLRAGAIQIPEVRKINEHLAVEIPYLEHMAGCVNLCLSRALFCGALAQGMELDPERGAVAEFASLWHNAMALHRRALEAMEPFSPTEQAPEGLPAAEVEAVLKDLERETPRTVEGAIVALCDRFDHMVFDRTLLRDRTQETVSAKEGISLLRIEERHDATLINHLEAMMVAPEEVETPLSPGEMVALPGDPELLAEAIARQFSPDQREALLRRLGEGTGPENPQNPADPAEPSSAADPSEPTDSEAPSSSANASDESPDTGIEMTI
jgi:class 3 adenylate cyclase/HAMP domain-containing protein